MNPFRKSWRFQQATSEKSPHRICHSNMDTIITVHDQSNDDDDEYRSASPMLGPKMMLMMRESPNPIPKFSQPITTRENPEVYLETSVLAQITAFGPSKSSSDMLDHPVVQTYLDIKCDRMKVFLFFTYAALRVFIYGFYMLLLYQVGCEVLMLNLN